MSSLTDAVDVCFFCVTILLHFNFFFLKKKSSSSSASFLRVPWRLPSSSLSEVQWRYNNNSNKNNDNKRRRSVVDPSQGTSTIFYLFFIDAVNPAGGENKRRDRHPR